MAHITNKLRGLVAAFVAVFAALALVPGTAFALTNDSTGSVTINGLQPGDTVTLYKVVDTTYSDPAAGGNITAKIECRARVTMATVRTACGADSVVFSVGRGAEGSIEKIWSAAEKQNASLCCSRAVVDDGLLPYANQVGLTGKTIAPKVYVAFGISGSVQHMCAVERAGTIIAINRDKNARIFDFADFGIIENV